MNERRQHFQEAMSGHYAQWDQLTRDLAQTAHELRATAGVDLTPDLEGVKAYKATLQREMDGMYADSDEAFESRAARLQELAAGFQEAAERLRKRADLAQHDLAWNQRR